MALDRRTAGLVLLLGCDPVNVLAPAFSDLAVPPYPSAIRVATFNTALSRDAPGELATALRAGDKNAEKIARIVKEVNPDILLVNEVDGEDAATILAREILGYPYVYVPAVNTGVPSGRDFDHDGRIDGPGDAKGFGKFPGQFGMAVASRYPIIVDAIQCFGDFRWADFPDSKIPTDWYDDEDARQLPLSSKNHCAVPIEAPPFNLWLFVSHPTPPVFDGPEDRNGRRNHDEIAFWGQLLDHGFEPGGPYFFPYPYIVVLGDLNADPFDGDADPAAIQKLLMHRWFRDARPQSAGAVVAAQAQGGRNAMHNGPPQLDTADFPDSAVGNLRVDYVLPSTGLEVRDAGVFWPKPGDLGAEWVEASDHRLVWVELVWPPVWG